MSLSMTNTLLEFVVSMTVCESDIRKIREHLALSRTTINPLRTVLLTPLFADPGAVAAIHQLAESGSRVFFDSGGYYVQIGRMRYEEIYLPLMHLYKQNRWASVYTLPDHVPTSQDSPADVARKVHDTITFSTMFFHEMPDDLKSRAMPVVQGHSLRQIDECLTAYIDLGVQQIGFGSFGTAGKNAEINLATNSAVDLASYVIKIAHEHNMKVHIFGLGAPALVAMLKGIQADSFDSSSWMKAAGFGQIFLPFMRAYNISHNTTVSELQKGITAEQFQEWSKLGGHRCELCASWNELQDRKMYRAVHNLITIVETVAMANRGEYERIRQIYHRGSAKYRQEFEKWLQPN